MSHAQSFLQSLQNNPSQLEQLRTGGKTALECIATEAGIPLTPEELTWLHNQLSSEMSEDQLSNIYGGGGKGTDSKPSGPGIKG